MNIQIGQEAPAFSLPDQSGKFHELGNYKGKWVLLYFYPKDGTDGCTMEACNFRDKHENFASLNAKVLGVSIDNVESHENFASQNNLNFPILADAEQKVATLYGVNGQGYMGGASRTSFLIDPSGKIVKIYLNVDPGVHAEEVIKDMEAFKN